MKTQIYKKFKENKMDDKAKRNTKKRKTKNFL